MERILYQNKDGVTGNLIGHDKEQHICGVARYMWHRAPDYGLDPCRMYVLGLLHDVGVADCAERGVGHEERGEEILRGIGLPEDMARAVGLHGADLTTLPPEALTDELLLLVEADLSVPLGGSACGFDERLKDLRSRYSDCSTAEHGQELIRRRCMENGAGDPEEFFRRNRETIVNGAG